VSQLAQGGVVYRPAMDPVSAEKLSEGWHHAVRQTILRHENLNVLPV
jgi:hypothetical protein